MPAWFFYSCVMGYPMVTLLVWVMIRRWVADMPLDAHLPWREPAGLNPEPAVRARAREENADRPRGCSFPGHCLSRALHRHCLAGPQGFGAGRRAFFPGGVFHWRAVRGRFCPGHAHHRRLYQRRQLRGGPGVAYTLGLGWVLLAMIQAPITFLTLGVSGKRFAIVARRVGAVTVVDFLYALYRSDAVVITCSVAMLVFFMASMLAQFIGGGRVFQAVTGYPYGVGLALFGISVVAYIRWAGSAPWP